MVNIIIGSTPKPLASEELTKYFQMHSDLEGYLYIGYPIIGTVEGAYPIDALWISRERGLVIFNLVENKSIEGYEEIQDDCANKVESKLKGYKQLVDKRQLCVDINVITFAPSIGTLEEYNKDYPLCNANTLAKCISELEWKEQ